MKRYLEEIGLIAADIGKIFPFFLDWNIKKLVLVCYAFGVAVILSIPGFLLAGLIAYSSPNMSADITTAIGVAMTGSALPEELEASLVQNIGSVVALVLIAVVIISIFVLACLYAYSMLLPIYFGYRRGEKIPLFSLPFFSWSVFKKFLGVILWQGVMSLIFFVPLAIGLGILIGQMIANGGQPNGAFLWGFMLFSMIGFTILFYFYFRSTFAFVAIFDPTNNSSGWATAKTVWKTMREPKTLLAIAVMLPCLVIYGVVRSLLDAYVFPESTLGSFVRFFLTEGISLMMFVTIYARIQAGKFFAKK